MNLIKMIHPPKKNVEQVAGYDCDLVFQHLRYLVVLFLKVQLKLYSVSDARGPSRLKGPGLFPAGSLT